MTNRKYIAIVILHLISKLDAVEENFSSSKQKLIKERVADEK